jgi:outer membrane protein TolC
VELTRQQLQSLTNQPMDALAALNPKKLDLHPPLPDDVKEWVRRAEEASPEMRTHRSRLATATLEIDKAQAGHLPTLDAVAQWSRSMSENTQAIESGNATRSLGLQLTIPVFSGGSVNSAVRQALASKTRAEQLLEGGRRDVALKVFREYRGVTEGILRVKALEQAVRSAEQALVSANRSFLAGSRTRLDVLNAESARMLAMRDLGQSRYLYLLSHLRLKALVNETNAQTIDAMNAWFQE